MTLPNVVWVIPLYSKDAQITHRYLKFSIIHLVMLLVLQVGVNLFGDCLGSRPIGNNTM